MAEIVQLTKATPEILKDLNTLVVELRQEQKTPGSLSDLVNALKDPNMTIVVAQEEDRIVGIGMLLVMEKIGKKKAFLEDVVVAEDQRGKGFGTGIMNKLIEIAKEKKVNTIQLTSGLKRTAAHALYEKLGFELHDTRVYRMKL